MDKSEELEIVNQAKENIQAFKRIYDYYFPKIFAYCYNRISNTDICKDLVSEVFLDAVEAIKNFDTSKSHRFGSWLYRVAYNKIVDHYKSQKRQVDNSIEDYKNLQNNDDLDIAVKNDEMRIKINLILTKLKLRYQLIITLRYFEELETEEIAEIMQISHAQVALIQHRALKSFRSTWEKNFPKSEISDFI